MSWSYYGFWTSSAFSMPWGGWGHPKHFSIRKMRSFLLSRLAKHHTIITLWMTMMVLKAKNSRRRRWNHRNLSSLQIRQRGFFQLMILVCPVIKFSAPFNCLRRWLPIWRPLALQRPFFSSALYASMSLQSMISNLCQKWTLKIDWLSFSSTEMYLLLNTSIKSMNKFCL